MRNMFSKYWNKFRLFMVINLLNRLAQTQVKLNFQ
jgi:hypothetical protein